MEKGDLAYAGKKIQILSLKNSEKETALHGEKKAEIEIKQERIVEVHGDVMDIGIDKLRLYVENKSCGEIESENFDAEPPTITFSDKEAAGRLVATGTLQIDGKSVLFKQPDPEAVDVTFGVDTTLAIDGKATDVWPGLLISYLRNPSQSGGGELKEINLSTVPPTVTFANSMVAKRVVKKKTHKIDGKDISFRFIKTTTSNDGDARQEKDRRTLEIHGDVTKIGKETLLMYFQSKRRSGGGEIESYNFERCPMVIRFYEAKVAKRVTEKGKHIIDENEFIVRFPDFLESPKHNEVLDSNKDDDGRVVEIHGHMANIGRDTLLMYLKNTKRSDGGDIEKDDFDNRPPTVTFCKAEVARRVVDRGSHSIDGKEFFVNFPASNAPVESDGTDIDARVVEVHGDIANFDEEFLLLYLENKRRSGGGEIETHDFHGNPPTVKFCDAEAAKRVVDKGTLHFDGKELLVKFPSPNAPETLEDSSSGDDVGARVVEIHGDVANFDEEILLMYLENTKRSGGGEIETHDLHGNPPTIKFCDAEAAERAAAKKVHTVNNVTFSLKLLAAKKPTALKKNVLLVSNLSSSTTLEHLTLYLERLCRDEPKSIKYNHDKTSAMVVLPNALDWRKVEQEHRRKDSIGGTKVKIEPVAECDSVFISNISKNTIKDALELKLEKVAGYDSISEIYFEQGRGFATAKCQNYEAMEKLKKSKVTLDSKELAVEEFYPKFIQDRMWKMINKGSDEIEVEVNPLIMKGILGKHKKEICEVVNSEVYMKQIIEDDGQKKNYACFKAELPDARKKFNSFYERFCISKISHDNSLIDDQMIESEIKKNHYHVTLYSDPTSGRSVAGVKEHVEKIIETFERRVTDSSTVEQIIECPDEKVELLNLTGHLKEFERAANVKATLSQNGLKVIGLEQHISEFEKKLLFKLLNVKERCEKISQNICRNLTSNRGRKSLSELIDRQQLHVVFNVDKARQEICFIGLNLADLNKATEAFTRHVKDNEYPIEQDQILILKREKGICLLKELEKRYPVVIKIGSEKISFSGIQNFCERAYKELKCFLNENALKKMILPLTRGKTKAVCQIQNDVCEHLMKEYQDNEISIRPSSNSCSIEISGRGNAVSDVFEALDDLGRKLHRKEEIFQRPGLSKFIDTKSFRNSILALEKEHSVVIINKDEDQAGFIPDEYVEKEYDIISPSNSSVMVCQFKMDQGKMLAVYDGDITNHKADAIVNPANEKLWLGGGVAGAILSKGGQEIQKECNQYIQECGELNEADIVTTGSGELSCSKIIHAFGPRWTELSRHLGELEVKNRQERARNKLAETMANVLEEAEKQGSQVLAIPAISSGVFGFPKDICASILTKTTFETLRKCKFENLKEIHFINIDNLTVEAFDKEFNSLFGSREGFYRNEKAKVASVKVSSEATGAKQKKNLVAQREKRLPSAPNELNSQHSNSIDLLNGLKIELVIGDLACVQADIVVNSVASNLDLTKNPCARGLSKAAGGVLQRECKKYLDANGSVQEYQFMETTAGNLKCNYVLHAVCGQYNGQSSEKDLSDLVLRLLDKADTRSATSIAIPALGTGMLAFPRGKVAESIINSVIGYKKKRRSQLKTVLLVAFHADKDTVSEFKRVFKDLPSRLQEKESDDHSDENVGSTTEKTRRAPEKLKSLSAIELEDKVFKLGNIVLEIVCGDITKENTDAIALFGDKDISLLGAVGNAIAKREGSYVREQAKYIAPQKPGTTKLLKTKNLPSKHIAHVFPRSDDYDGLREATKKMFQKCDSKHLESISLPAIGTGVLGMSPLKSAKLILHAFAEICMADSIRNLKKLRIVLFEEAAVAPFKSEIFDLLANPDKYKQENNASLVNWFKKQFSNIKDWLSSSHHASKEKVSYERITKNNREGGIHQWLPITWYVYGKDKRSLNGIQKKLTEIFDDGLITLQTQKEAYKRLSKHVVSEIKYLAEKRDVLFELDESTGTMRFVGFSQDAADIMVLCQEKAMETGQEELEQEKEQTVAQFVQWKEKQDDGTVINYDPKLNCQIETLFKEKSPSPRIEMLDDTDTRCFFDIDFNAMTVSCVNSPSKPKTIIREELGSSKAKLPTNWTPMPKNPNGNEPPVLCVPLKTSSQEFIDVANQFKITAGDIPINSIQRIQNPQLYSSFMARKESMEKTAGAANVNEKRLFHGTASHTVNEINETGFNRSFAGVNGVAYGVGVYFARDANYSLRYSQGQPGIRHMYLARVLAGKFTNGSPVMKVPPKGFDTVVDNVGNPSIHVVFYDNQCYPEYLITF